jgi:hypothetical protein
VLPRGCAERLAPTGDEEMTNCKLQDQISDAMKNLEEVAGSAGRIHVLVEVADEGRWRELLGHADARLSVRRNNRPPPLVVRWTLGGEP